MLLLSPIDPLIEKHGMLILDGGLATELEKMGFNLSTHLWSAHFLESNPEAIRKVHLSYLKAGANCIISASYQASISGFISEGFSEKKAKSLLERSVALANEASNEYLELLKDSGTQRIRPLVAASIGPYGAYLANGAEYNGNYKVSKSELTSFHESRWEILCNCPVSLFACETIPSFKEAEVLLEILRQTPEIFAWMSFSCRDKEHISDGTLIRECATLFKGCDQVVAVGINCTAPKYISSLVKQVRLSLPNKPVVVYPNSGNIYDSEKKTWLGKSDPLDYGIAACDWFRSGARLIGGCCQIGPKHIQAMRETLLNQRLYQA
ncbi:MAG: homocysteine S-methyltransferase [Ignavibacteria bacterium]|nr:homocysteine S-methyltransferase [Ignavibacteria bacterium]MBT8381755.1 homocysteine S-methyltransferase [Ignavibacteria bacterium]NNJ53985.1 homocysteine S-methyltransferase [Ignavibacteriaceae bacterium]NNL21580.1 homocysteine S-methyltransferase [Ignavibacteriaceae bacterium]